MIAIAIATLAVLVGQSADASTPGQLAILDKQGRPTQFGPLQGTKIDADIAGFGARVTVVQSFVNPSSAPVDAVYTFPLPHDAAVDRMRFQVGPRIIEGQVRRRDEARRIYEAAKSAGQAAALLDQERPNIFTQSVANIQPNAVVRVEISYVQILKFEKGEFEFSFPLAIGTRFTDNAKDSDKITPSAAARSGANVELNIRLDAGAPIVGMKSVQHDVKVEKRGAENAIITLVKKGEIPNKDFILKYQTATDTVQSAFVTSWDKDQGGFFTLVLLPPKNPTPELIRPREMIFVMDQSGSQEGFPIEKSKELTLRIIQTLRPEDTFNVFGFNNSVRSLFDQPQPANPETIASATKFVTAMQANGGTQLLEGLRASLLPKKDPERLRMIVFNTDGQVGDEPEILDTIVKNKDAARIFTFGIGDSVNRFLIDTMSAEGRGDSEIVTRSTAADQAVERFLQRTRSPILTDITAHLEGDVGIADVLPRRIPDVFSERPIVLMGRYQRQGTGTIALSGNLGEGRWSKNLKFDFSTSPGTSCIPTLWARKKVDDLQSRSYTSMTSRAAGDSVAEAVTDVALTFRLMTQYTSFVAVESRILEVAGKQYAVHLPISEGSNSVGSAIDYISYDPVDNSLVVAGTAAGSFRRTAGGAASGGFGGGGGGAGRTAPENRPKAPERRVRPHVEEALRKAAEAKKRALTEAEKTAVIVNAVVDVRLRDLQRKVGIMVWLADTSKATLQKLRLAGFEPEIVDDKVRLVFGECEPSMLTALAQIDTVDRITPIE